MYVDDVIDYSFQLKNYDIPASNIRHCANKAVFIVAGSIM